MTRILYLDWNSFAGEYMKSALVASGADVVLFPFNFNVEGDRKDTRMDEELTKSIVMTLMSGRYDAVFSFNYFPVAAMAAKACRVRYVAWVYDSPYIQLYSQTINFPTNDIRLFDNAEVKKLSDMGVRTVSYLPLAADSVSLRNKVLSASEADIKKYTSDISFVGSLYTEPKHRLFERLFRSSYDEEFGGASRAGGSDSFNSDVKNTDVKNADVKNADVTFSDVRISDIETLELEPESSSSTKGEVITSFMKAREAAKLREGAFAAPYNAGNNIIALSSFIKEREHAKNGNGLSDEDRLYLLELIEKQKNIYGWNFIEESLSSELCERMNKICPLRVHPDGFETKQWVYANYYMYRYVTALERTEIMNLLSQMDYDLKIYTHPEAILEDSEFPQTEGVDGELKGEGPYLSMEDLGAQDSEDDFLDDFDELDSEDDFLDDFDALEPEVAFLSDKAKSKVCGTVDYYSQAPVVFANSKINLNISLRSIGSGIPLRAFEIMGSGGFLLTNYQADMDELFVAGEDYVYYEDYDDMIAKIDYYLSHDEEREQIAANGYAKVQKLHNYQERVREMFANVLA